MGKRWFIIHRGNRWTGQTPRAWKPSRACSFLVLTKAARVAIETLPFRGWYVWRVWSRGATVYSPSDPLAEERRRPDVKKVKVSEKSSVKHLAALESEYFRDVLSVVDAIGMLQYDDGTPRQAGYLGIWTQGSAWVARVTDKDANATLTAEGRTLDEALDLLAMLLGSEDAPWEQAASRKRKS